MKRVRGGGFQERETFSLWIFVSIIIFLAVLMSLMWSNNIQFASDDQRNLVAGSLTVGMIILVICVLYLISDRGTSCDN